MKLYDYQERALSELGEKIKLGYKRIVIVLATGGGKTNVACEIIRRARSKGKRVIFLAHRQELVYQAHERLSSFGIDAGIIMPPHKPGSKDVYIASVQTLIRREHPQADIIFIDEAHRVLASSYKSIISAYKDAFIFGLTATPYRLDGKPLGEIFQEVINPISVQDLIDQGFLVQPRYYASKKDLREVKISKGDYDTAELFKALDKKVLYGEVVDKHRKYGKGRTLVFCVNIEHSKNTCQAFVDAGYASAHIDCDTPSAERKVILRDFGSGKYQILCNVAILTEGYNLPSVETIVLNRATKSKALYLQMTGRGIRAFDGKSGCVVIDHGNNVYEHGMIEDQVEIDIHRKNKRRKAGGEIVQAKNCPNCDALCGIRALTCRGCGHIFDINNQETQVVDVEFAEIVKPKVKIPAHLRKPWSKMTDEELNEFRKLKGYRKGWIFYQKKIREERKALYV